MAQARAFMLVVCLAVVVVVVVVVVVMSSFWTPIRRTIPGLIQTAIGLAVDLTDYGYVVEANPNALADLRRWWQERRGAVPQESVVSLKELRFRLLAVQNGTNRSAEDVAFVSSLRRYYWRTQQEVYRQRQVDPVAASHVTRWTETIAARLDALQRPANCEKARFIRCSMVLGCGFACHVHQFIYCLLVAYANNRTLVIDDASWRYYERGWSEYFLPVTTPQCDEFVLRNRAARPFAAERDHVQILSLPFVQNAARVPYLPPAVPLDVARDLEHVHSALPVWWIGQLASYLMRPNPTLRATLERAKARLGFRRPIVGMHIRRTDKVGIEANFHDVAEYVAVTEELFDALNLTASDGTRRVYLATDEREAVGDARNRYPNLTILWNENATEFAPVEKRYTSDAALGIVLDVLLLAECDVVVCTMSSNVCRLVYELMQTRFVDASWRVHSLDWQWHYGGGQQQRHVAIQNHTAASPSEIEIDLTVGDPVQLSVDWVEDRSRGFMRGTNLRTKRVGFYPFYKVEPVLIAERLPRDGPQGEARVRGQ